MTSPGDDVSVVTNALRREAGVWDGEAAEMGKIGPRAETLRLDRIEAGVFQIVVNAYAQLIDQVIGRANEGRERMTEIATTLRSVADKYDHDEAERVLRLRRAGWR